MFQNLEELHAEIICKDPKIFVSHYIFEPVPFVFDNNNVLWIDWKTKLAEMIDVDPRDIVLTGSSALGFSLNPSKSFKKFDAGSDIDCGIISEYYFNLAWRYLRQLQPNWLSLPADRKSAIKHHRRNYVFAGTIAADQILELLPFGQVWQTALDEMRHLAPTTGRDIKMRIYKDFDSLRYYQSRNIANLRAKISDQTPSPDTKLHQEEIGTED